MNKDKTNNSYLYDKVAIRLINLPDKEKITVLDCFHGNGLIWKNVIRNTKKKIIVNGIDISDYDELSLKGDNLKILDSIDVSKYDIIDLDSYGVPDKQISKIWNRLKKNTIVFYTFIQTNMGRLSNSLLMELGYTESMINKIPSLFNKKGHAKFINFLSLQPCAHVLYLNHGRKYYGMIRKE